ncbi:MAG: Hsp20/alpha crystallin family protein [Anaerolineaceae bacterium]|nr:Hsp20/alpha crystallin family protein [Anaerolineaceae bacterium]
MYRRIRVPSIWREMDQLQREMSRLFEDAVGKRTVGSFGFPAINLWANDDGQFIRAEIPGFKPDDINIEATADTLTISGSRSQEKEAKGKRYHRQERGYGSFTRTIQLPFIIDTGSVEANYKNGILNIKLQRAESDKPKKIAVKSE